MRLVGTVLTLLLGGWWTSPQLNANGCHVVAVRQKVVAVKEVAAIAVPVITPVVIAYPAFSFTYSAAAVVQAPVSVANQVSYQQNAVAVQQQAYAAPVVAPCPSCNDGTPAINMNGYNESRQQQGGQGQIPEGFARVLSTRCASCHTAPASKGNGVVMFSEQGQLTGNADLLAAAVEQVALGRMPKGSQLPDGEYAEVMSMVRALVRK